MNKKLLALLLALAMVAALMAGCSSSGETAPAVEETKAVEESAPAAEEKEAPVEDSQPVEAAPEEAADEEAPAEPVDVEVVYELPLTDKEVSFTHWGEGAPPFVTPYLGDGQCFATAPATDYMAELTGIRIEYVEVDMFSKAEKFNLMIASGDYTDMIVGLDTLYSGGPTQALNDEVIFDLTDYVEGNMPAYKGVIDASGVVKDLLSDEGEFLYITGFDDEIYAGAGPAIRKDWLDELGLDIPHTYDELYEVACAFRDNYNCTMPIYFTASLNPGVWFSGGFDIPAFDIKSNGSHFYQVDGQVQSAYVSDNLKEMIKVMAQYYQQGLISKDFINRETGADCESDLFSNNIGLYAAEANWITDYNNMMADEDTTFHLVGCPMLVKEEGQIIHFKSNTTNGAGRNTICITTNCKDVALLTTFLDFQFTEEGQLLNNYGIEGITYEFDENGDPQWIDGLPSSGIEFMAASVPYIINALPSLFDADRRDKVTLDQDALDARALYNEGVDGAYDLPSGMYLNEAEGEIYNPLIADIDTFAAEFLLKCVYGEADINAGWDSYIDQLYALGLQDCINAKQSAYDRYLAR